MQERKPYTCIPQAPRAAHIGPGSSGRPNGQPACFAPSMPSPASPHRHPRPRILLQTERESSKTSRVHEGKEPIGRIVSAAERAEMAFILCESRSSIQTSLRLFAPLQGSGPSSFLRAYLRIFSYKSRGVRRHEELARTSCSPTLFCSSVIVHRDFSATLLLSV